MKNKILHLKFHLGKISFATLKTVLKPFYLLNHFISFPYKNIISDLHRQAFLSEVFHILVA